MTITLAIILGILFGFTLHRVGASNPENIINMLRLSDLHLMKAIVGGIGIASIGLFIGMAVGLIDSAHLSIKASNAGVVLGGAILGIGFAIAGYCPGTGVAAAGEGRKDAFSFVIGGLVGAALYMLSYSWFKANGWLDGWLGGKVSIADTGVTTSLIENINGSIVAIIIGLILLALAIYLPNQLRRI